MELGLQFAWHSRVHTPESRQDVAYCQAEATGAGSSDFAREKCGRRVEYIAWQRKRESLKDAKTTRTVAQASTHLKESISVPNWSDGSMWMQVLEAGESGKQKVTIFNILEYIGAWEWYDRQVKSSQATVLTKKKKLVDRKGAATQVLNQMQDLQTSAEQPGKWIRGVGRITLSDKRYESANSLKSYDASIVEQDRKSQRRRITIQLSRGQKLSTRIVKELSLDILFRLPIWCVVMTLWHSLAADGVFLQGVHQNGREITRYRN